VSGGDLRDALPGDAMVLDIHVGELRQLFHSMDPAPFRERDLDPKAEEYIVEWSREVRPERPLALVVQIDRSAGTLDEERALRDAVHAFFEDRAATARRRLRQLLQEGRRSLAISLVFLAAMVLVGDFLAALIRRERSAEILKEGLLIGGWVAMWRPLEIFLYGWWPIRADARLYDRLSAMTVRVVHPSPAAASPVIEPV